MAPEQSQISFADDLVERFYRPVVLSEGAKALLEVLRGRTAKAKQAELAVELNMNAATIRNLIRELRRGGWLVCTDSDGCWLPRDRAEIERTIKSLSGRGLSILATVAAMKKR